MTRVSQMITSNFIRKEDLQGNGSNESLILTVKSDGPEDMPGEAGEQRWVLRFEEVDKGLVLNVTNIRACEAAWGPESDNWKGKKVELFVDPTVQYKGKVEGGLRLRPVKNGSKLEMFDTPPAKKKGRRSSPLVTPRPEEAFDDKIPYERK